MTITVRVADPFGIPLDTIANFTDEGGPGLDYVLSVGNPFAALKLTLPPPPITDVSLFQRDTRLAVWRSVAGRPPYLDGQAIWLCRKFETSERFFRVTAFHANHLLTRRIIAYNATGPTSVSTYTSKVSAPADNIIKAFVRENMGNLITTIPYDRDSTVISDRIQADISAYVPVQTNLGLGAAVEIAAARRKLDEVVREVGEASTTAGTYLTTEVVAPTESTLEVRTFTGQRGVDHRAGTTQPVIFAVERGNIENVILTEDYTNEVTVAIVGGMGQRDYRMKFIRADTTRITASPFNRIERFLDMSNISDFEQLAAAADAALREGRPIITMQGDLVDTAGCTRGIHYDLGDMVTVAYGGRQFDVRLDVLNPTYSNGALRTKAVMRGTL